MWCILPGLALTPHDFEPLKQALASYLPANDEDIRILDSWEVPVTGPIRAIQNNLLHDIDSSEPVNVIGHSVGGLAALEWAAQSPDQVKRLVLLDPTAPVSSPILWRWATRAWETDLLSTRLVRCLTYPGTWLAARIAPGMRDFSLRRSSTPNHLLPAQSQERYGSPEVVNKIAEQFFQSWQQQDRVAKLFGTQKSFKSKQTSLASSIEILHIVGVGSYDRAFVDEQRHLGEFLGSELHCLLHTNHLFPLSHPTLVAELISRWTKR